ncbi:hypothetical protein K523DRAFT_326256 [Schizophyllum commune Tattone D]|nr:hypothetical protein K523DRAFT_326256 [Schizophyllum commune Tattone D]
MTSGSVINAHTKRSVPSYCRTRWTVFGPATWRPYTTPGSKEIVNACSIVAGVRQK